MSASKHFKGKGSKQRPTDKNNPRAYQDNWEKIFGNKKQLSDRERVLMDPLAASQRSDNENKKEINNDTTKTDK